LKRVKWFSGLALVFQVMLGSTAWAHHPIIQAAAVCSEGQVVVNYTATAWATDIPNGRANTRIDIQFNGVTVESGAFTQANNYQFSNTKPAPSGSGSFTVAAVAIDPWGDGGLPGGSTSVEVTRPESCGGGTGRFTGGGKEISLVGGLKITDGLTIHCDLKLSNNLEINWPGNKFHLTEHTFALCSDNPDIEQKPPKAPLDTLFGMGTGKYNNVDGYTIEFTLVDGGEPGTKDMIGLKIYQTSNPSIVVLNLPLQFVSGGNLQAHYDQPHK